MKEVRSLRRRLAFLVDATKDLQRRNDLVMAGREDENSHEVALFGDVNELIEEIEDVEIVDDDDENSYSKMKLILYVLKEIHSSVTFLSI